MRKLKSALAAAALVAAGASPALAMPSGYRYREDRFEGRRAAVADFSSVNCQLLRAYTGKLRYCFMVNEERKGVTLTFGTEWEALRESTEEQVPTVITYKNGNIAVIKLKMSRKPSVFPKPDSGTFIQSISFIIPPPVLSTLHLIKSVEVRHHATEYMWKPNKLALCAAQFTPSC